MLRRRFPHLLAIVLTIVAVLAVLAVPPKPMNQQPIPDGVEYASSAQHLASGAGFVEAWEGLRPQPPRYSPGFPIALAPFAGREDFPKGVQLGERWIAVFYVLVVVLAAWSLGGPLAGAFAAGIIILSPFARTSADLIMSDALGAALTVLVVPVIRFSTRAGDRLSGALLGFAATVRILAGVGLIAALIAIPGRESRRRVLLWAAPFIAGLLILQWLMFGNPLATGYDRWDAGFSQLFAITNPIKHAAQEGLWMYTEPTYGHLIDTIGPVGPAPGTGLQNLFFYPVVLLGILWIYTPPLITIVGLVWGWRHRDEPAVKYALLTILGTVVVYCFYQYQAARLIAAPASLLLVLTAVGMARCVAWAQRFEQVWREREGDLDTTGGGTGRGASPRAAAPASPGGW